jgi:hypothetical protein
MNDGRGATKFWMRGGAPRVGADGKAMGVERETMACVGGRRSAWKKKRREGAGGSFSARAERENRGVWL